MSTLVDRAIAAAGLAPIADARARGDQETLESLSHLLGSADLLALGALADRIRADEVGDVVRVFANVEADRGDDVVQVSPPTGAKGGLALLRRVAIARVAGPPRARVRVDWSETGLDVAQVALGFGASELSGPIANRRGLPIAEEAALKVKGAGMVSVQTLKKREIELLLAHAGRKAVFAAARLTASSPLESPHV
jgi:2-iminoacetate synthase ThiH